MNKKDLPLGIQDFEKLQTSNLVYVDKTELLYELVTPPQAFYFLSRPRRFGKSLLLSTLTCLFEGKKDLFKGLWINESPDWSWEKHPVINIDFNGISHKDPVTLEQDMLKLLNEIGEKHEIKLTTSSIPMRLKNLITSLQKKFRRTVVVLIDEYDKPIISHFGRGEEEFTIASKNRDVLKQLFGVLKDQGVSGALRFVFLTGVSKFARVSIFSDLNNLNDITMLPRYATLLGYTQDELIHSFTPHIKDLSQELEISPAACIDDLKLWYNGYQFTERNEKVYNPFSILSVLKNKKFKNYWFETGTPAFLLNLIKKNNYHIPLLEQLELRESAFTKYEIEDVSIEALLFQTGYITIKSLKGRLYKLDYPNQEVKNSFIDYLYEKIVHTENQNVKNKFTLLADFLINDNLKDFIDTVNIILASITYHQIHGRDKAFFHTVFYLMLSASGVEVLTEVLTSQGRMDIAVFFDTKIYIIELKCNRNAGEAIRQIKKMQYALKYKAEGKKIILMGINFDTHKREVTGWEYEEMPD